MSNSAQSLTTDRQVAASSHRYCTSTISVMSGPIVLRTAATHLGVPVVALAHAAMGVGAVHGDLGLHRREARGLGAFGRERRARRDTPRSARRPAAARHRA